MSKDDELIAAKGLAADAKRMLVGYFESAGVRIHSTSQDEIGQIVDLIINAAALTAIAKMKKELKDGS